jgi:DNA polymerase-3 subunit delta
MANLFLFTGEETYLLRQQVKLWKNEFQKKYGDFNLAHLDASQMKLGQIVAECRTLPFLSTKRLIFIENLPSAADQKLKKESADDYTILNDLVENPPESSVIIFISANPDKRTTLFKRIQKYGQVKCFDALGGRKLEEWIMKKTSATQGKILPGAINYLIQYTGNNLWILDQEIKKLISYNQGKPISERDIDLLVTPHPEANIFAFTDAITQRKIVMAIKLLQKLILSGESVNQIFYMLIRQFRILIQLKALKDKGFDNQVINAKLKLNPFVVKIALKQIDNFHFSELKHAYQCLLNIDEKLKTGRIKYVADDYRPFIIEIEAFLLNICQKKAELI